MVEQNTIKDQSFLSGLLETLAKMRRIETEAGMSTRAVQKEILRQIKQALKGDLITGKGVTKSGEED